MISPKTVEILIVDDDIIILRLHKEILKDYGNIDTTENGVLALSLIKKKDYKLIVCDIEMPSMNGISLFLEASSKYPNMSSRFLFITGCLTPQYRNFFEENNLLYLYKPTPVKELRNIARQIIHSEY